MFDFKKYKHMSFDLWLTLVKSHPEYKMERAKLLRDFFNISTSDEDILKTVKYYDNAVNKINEVTGGNIMPFEIYSLILTKYGADFDTQKLNDFYLESEKLFLRFPPVLLDHFNEHFFEDATNEGITLNILSNTGFIKGSTLMKFIETTFLKHYFDEYFFSDEYGMSKPNPEFFNVVRDYVDPKVLNHEILHIGDNYNADVLGGKNAGFSTCLVVNK